ncbi:MAG: XTP/dITP diphosphatase [Calditerrivibrio sp.]|nr:XTP/dITP diphosphatase [Calditerrivibrio sp.]MCA1932265.1 XTP/dITP diphosphatase [Calditerrivibrio sp.]
MMLLVSTKNKHKLKEIGEILSDSGFQVDSVYNYVDDIDVEETGNTFEDNAIIKAVTLSKQIDHYVIADDSGVSVEFLDGAPGVYSARYAGTDATDDDNNRLLLEKLSNLPIEKRKAKYVCVIALAKKGRFIKSFHGECHGYIGEEYKGNNGFGYDPIFVLPEGRHMAELSPEEKNKISHRYNALIKLKEFLKSIR